MQGLARVIEIDLNSYLLSGSERSEIAPLGDVSRAFEIDIRAQLPLGRVARRVRLSASVKGRNPRNDESQAGDDNRRDSEPRPSSLFGIN
jgi:hypothetical protein